MAVSLLCQMATPPHPVGRHEVTQTALRVEHETRLMEAVKLYGLPIVFEICSMGCIWPHIGVNQRSRSSTRAIQRKPQM